MFVCGEKGDDGKLEEKKGKKNVIFHYLVVMKNEEII